MELIGLLAGAMTSGACIPQAYKVIKTRNTRDLSFPTYSLLVFGCILWTVYRFQIGSIAIVVTNVFSTLTLGVIWVIMVSKIMLSKERLRIKRRLK